MIQFKCRACGRSISVREEHAGENGKCACGAVLQIPKRDPVFPASTTATGSVKPADSQAVIAHPSPVDDRMSRSNKRLLRGGISVCALIVIPVLLYFLVFRGKWENDHRQALLDLKTQAASLVAAGKIEEGYRKYEELFALLERVMHFEPLIRYSGHGKEALPQ
jgi:hypothetical protein